MNFPYFQVPYLGHGMVIGFNAIVHVILSHGIAIGVVLAIVLAEAIGYKKESQDWERFAHFAIKPTAIIISSVGAITGVGIWFTIGTLAPRASSSMLRIFFWPWFMEWIVFVIEAVIIVAYYLLWEKMSFSERGKQWHIAMGFAYPALGFISAFLITGIIGYMLTPDGFPWTWSRWDAFFNPSLWPQTFLRFFGGISLGMILVLILVLLWEKDSNFRKKSFRLYGALSLGFGILAAVCAYLYFINVPPTFRVHSIFAMLTSHLSQQPVLYYVFNGIALGLFLVFVLFALVGLSLAARIMLIPAIIGVLFFVTEYERTREFIRGPYVMSGYMLASQVLVSEMPYLNKTGVLQRAYWYQAVAEKPNLREIGEVLFAQNCKTCHSIGGINDIRDRVRGRPEDAIAAILDHTNEMIPFMPPFSGTREEKAAYAHYLYEISNGGYDDLGLSRFPEQEGGDDK